MRLPLKKLRRTLTLMELGRTLTLAAARSECTRQW
jgi:hypothetical protein